MDIPKGALCRQVKLPLPSGALIGLMGSMGSGKTTGADYLVRTHYFKDKAFADPLKEGCKCFFLFKDEQLYGTQAQKEAPDPRWFGCSARRALQFVGTDLLRNHLNEIMPGLGVNIFVHHFRIWYDEFRQLDQTTPVVLSDVRFQNEVDLIRELGGTVIKINRKKGPDVVGETSRLNLFTTCGIFMLLYLLIYLVAMYVCHYFSCTDFALFTFGLIFVALWNFIYVLKRETISSLLHQSESEMLKIVPDYTIHNDGSYSDFYESLESILGLTKVNPDN